MKIESRRIRLFRPFPSAPAAAGGLSVGLLLACGADRAARAGIAGCRWRKGVGDGACRQIGANAAA